MKNLLLLAIAICSVSIVQAQLYVAPSGTNPSDDNYVYVSDEVLFVEDGIDLRRNNTTNERPSVYLRNEAQLIQGSGTTPNSGNGSLSVLQNTPNDDSWDYTYWSAPVGRPKWNEDGNRAFDANLISDYQTVKNSVPAAFTNAYEGTESPLTISRRWIYMHERGQEEITSYQHIGNSWNFLNAGLGYTMKGVGTTNHDQIYDFRGRPHNGDISVNVYNGEWTLSGNPYPSALDLNAVYWETGNEEIFQFWYYDEDRSVDSHFYSLKPFGYGTYVPGPDPNDPMSGYDPDLDQGLYVAPTFSIWNSGGTNNGSNMGMGATYKRRFAPIGQGFMIVGDATGTITIKNEHRRFKKEGEESDFRSPDAGFSDVELPPNVIPQIRLNVSFVESHIRQLLLAFSDNASDGYDRGFDGKSPMDASSEAYFPMGSGTHVFPYTIQTLPFEIDKMIPLTVEINDQQHNVEVEVIDMVNFNEDVYLFDRVAQSYHEISNGHKSSVILNPGEYKNRFYVVFRNPRDDSASIRALGEKSKLMLNFFQNNPAKQLEVSNPEGYDVQEAQIYDMSGKLVYHGYNLGKETRYTFPTSHFSDGIYLVKLNTAEHGSIDYKINVFNK